MIMCCSTAHNGIGQAAGVRWRWLAIPIFDAQLHSCGQFPQLSFGIDATFDIPAGIILIQQLLWRSLGLGSAATTAVTMADMSRVVATATKSRVSASSEATAFKFASVSSGLPDSCSAMALQIRIREDKHAQASEAERSRLLRSFQLAADPPDVASMSCALAARRQLTFQPGVRTFRRVMRPPHLRPPNASYLWATVAATPLWWVLSLVPQQARCKWLCFTWTAQRGQLAKASRSTIQFSGLSCRGFCVGLVQQGLCRSACLPLSSQHLSAVLLVFLRKVGELRHPSVPTSDNSVDANRHIQQSGLKACRSFSFGDAAFRLVLQGLLGWIGALHQNIDDRSRASQVNMFASVEHQPHLPASLTSDISVNANLGSWPLYGLFHDALLPALTLTGRRSISCHVFLISRLACFLEYAWHPVVQALACGFPIDIDRSALYPSAIRIHVMVFFFSVHIVCHRAASLASNREEDERVRAGPKVAAVSPAQQDCCAGEASLQAWSWYIYSIVSDPSPDYSVDCRSGAGPPTPQG
ncbi:unnamed protein product [Symbiodinium natans]|uniref:Uncharacterized protein n=1 Tax=Symbiodinium natans TaxID=878477 RepID=A0A812R313_9DINO|nr:unnamed protein product [Symbiodinium natans]